MRDESTRRRWLAMAGAATIGTVIGTRSPHAAENTGAEEMEVSAVEDLMREHGVLRRALLVYAEAASTLAQGKSELPWAALGRTATLFRRFGEDYHERGLEEKHVFVPLAKGGGAHAALVRTLTAQHERGREITDYIVAMARKARLVPADAASFSRALAMFVRMYEHHAAVEDTVIFPAWKAAISPAHYHDLNEQFEALEHQMFGADGFEEAVAQVAAIERDFGLADLNALTAPLPPRGG